MSVNPKTAIIIAAVVLFLTGLGVYLWADSIIDEKDAKIDALQDSVDLYDAELQEQIRDNERASDSLNRVYSQRLDSVRVVLSNDSLRAHIIDSLKNNQYDPDIDTMPDPDVERLFSRYYSNND